MFDKRGCVVHLGDMLEVLPTLEADSVDAMVTDPPYHLTSQVATQRSAFPGRYSHGKGKTAAHGFMGKQWDGGDIAMRPETWAEVHRVLKPGGHLLCFAGTRTAHRIFCAVEDAGFEVRDQIFWHYGQGFPKSLNVSKILGAKGYSCQCHRTTLGSMDGHDIETDRAAHGEAGSDLRGVRSEVLPQREASGPGEDASLRISVQRGASGQGMGEARASRETGLGSEPRGFPLDPLRRGEPGLEGRGDVLPEEGQLCHDQIRPLPGRDAPDGQEGWLCHGASVDNGSLGGQGLDQDRVCPSLRSQPKEQQTQELGAVAGQPEPQAGRAWQDCGRCGKPIVPDGLGTALKPSTEPILLARKPLSEATVAANVQRWGTGAINVESCRIPTTDSRDRSRGSFPHSDDAWGAGHLARTEGHPAGRWPANLAHDGSDEVLDAFASFGDKGGGWGQSTRGRGRKIYGDLDYETGQPIGYGDDPGTAARFFYSAKASKADRAGSKHPTVKPVALMRWLVRLVTPPGGTVLDPFAGSGTTLQAALEEGFRCIGIEREAEYHADILRRLEGVGPVPRETPSRKAKPKDPAQLDLVDLAAAAE